MTFFNINKNGKIIFYTFHGYFHGAFFRFREERETTEGGREREGGREFRFIIMPRLSSYTRPDKGDGEKPVAVSQQRGRPPQARQQKAAAGAGKSSERNQQDGIEKGKNGSARSGLSI